MFAVVIGVGVVVIALVAAVVVWALSDGSPEAPPANSDGAAASSASEAAPPNSDANEGTVTADALGREVIETSAASGTPLDQTGQPGSFASVDEGVPPPAGYALQRLPSGVTVAVSESDGPNQIDGGAMTGYAHSPQGAGLVAINYTGFGMSMSQATKDFMVSVAPAAERDAAEGARGYGAEAEAKMRDYIADGYAAPDRIRFRECSEAFCTVEVGSPSVFELAGEVDAETDPRMHTVTRVSMKWEEDKWVIVDSASQELRDFDESWGRW